MLIGSLLLGTSQFSGTFIMSNYAATIFRYSGSEINPNVSSIIISVMQVIGTSITSNLIDRVGRKILLIVSCSGMAIALSITGAFTYLSMHEYDVTAWNFVPILSLSIYMFVAAVGILPVPYVYLTEILPQKVKRASAVRLSIKLN